MGTAAPPPIASGPGRSRRTTTTREMCHKSPARCHRRGCPYRKPKTADRDGESADPRPDERSLQIDLVHLDRTVPVASCLGSRRPQSSKSSSSSRGAPAPAGCGAVGRCRNCGVWRSRGSRASRAARAASVRTPAQGCPKRPRRPGSMPSRGFFAELTLRRLKRGVFRSVDDLKATINRLTPIQSPWSGPPPSSPLSNAGNKR